ncbi:hypothetical protein Hanom_Chr03g00193731 [Helianthus anomalus]
MAASQPVLPCQDTARFHICQRHKGLKKRGPEISKTHSINMSFFGGFDMF